MSTENTDAEDAGKQCFYTHHSSSGQDNNPEKEFKRQDHIKAKGMSSGVTLPG